MYKTVVKALLLLISAIVLHAAWEFTFDLDCTLIKAQNKSLSLVLLLFHGPILLSFIYMSIGRGLDRELNPRPLAYGKSDYPIHGWACKRFKIVCLWVGVKRFDILSQQYG
jgi:hypothetical protein